MIAEAMLAFTPFDPWHMLVLGLLALLLLTVEFSMVNGESSRLLAKVTRGPAARSKAAT